MIKALTCTGMSFEAGFIRGGHCADTNQHTHLCGKFSKFSYVILIMTSSTIEEELIPDPTCEMVDALPLYHHILAFLLLFINLLLIYFILFYFLL